MATYKKATGDLTDVDLTSIGTSLKVPTEIYIANTHSSNQLTVGSLKLLDSSDTEIVTIIANVVVPVGTALILDSKAVSFNPRLHKLRITTTGSANVSIIIT